MGLCRPPTVPRTWSCRARVVSWARPAAHALHWPSCRAGTGMLPAVPCRPWAVPCRRAVGRAVSPWVVWKYIVALVVLYMHILNVNILSSHQDSPLYEFSRTRHPLYIILHTNKHPVGPTYHTFLTTPGRLARSHSLSPFLFPSELSLPSHGPTSEPPPTPPLHHSVTSPPAAPASRGAAPRSDRPRISSLPAHPWIERKRCPSWHPRATATSDRRLLRHGEAWRGQIRGGSCSAMGLSLSPRSLGLELGAAAATADTAQR
jgi:hypothetical protein